MIYRFLIRLLFRLTDKLFTSYDDIDKRATEKWLYQSFKDNGFISYFKYEDLRILKALGLGQEGPKYWIYVGRRLQLLNLYNSMNEAFQLRAAAEGKARDREAKQSKAAEKGENHA